MPIYTVALMPGAPADKSRQLKILAENRQAGHIGGVAVGDSPSLAPADDQLVLWDGASSAAVREQVAEKLAIDPEIVVVAPIS